VPLILKALIHVFEVFTKVKVLHRRRVSCHAMDKGKVLFDLCLAHDLNKAELIELILDTVFKGDLVLELILASSMTFIIVFIEVLDRGLLL
jgi:hypothetical protein